MKRIIGFLMALMMLVSSIACVDLSALASVYMDYTYKDGMEGFAILADPPTDIRVKKISSTFITLQWRLNYYDIEELSDLYKDFGVEICKYNASTKKYSHVAYVKHTSESYRIVNLKVNTGYTFALRAYTVSEGERIFGKYTKKISVRTAPKETSLTSVKYVSTGKMQVKWKKVSGVSGYIIKYSPSEKVSNTSSSTCTYAVSGADKASATINGLAKKKYYVKICTYKTLNTNKYCSDFSSIKSVTIKKGASLKTMLNSIKTDNSGRAEIKSLTHKGVDIAKYSTTYDKIKAIYNWHSKHNTNYGWTCLDCNTNFNRCLAALMKNSRNKFDEYLYIAGNNIKNGNGSKVEHKWSVVYISGVKYIFDPRLQGYTGNKTGNDYFGIAPGSAKSKMYLFDYYIYYWDSIQDFYSFKNCLIYAEAKPAKVTVKKIQAAKKGFKLTWNAQSSGKGYQISYSTNSKFSSAKSVYVDNIKSASKTVSGLKSGKTYYVKIRAYKQFGNTKQYGSYSTVYKIKTK